MKSYRWCLWLGLFMLPASLWAQTLPDIEGLLESNNIEGTDEGYEEMVSTLFSLLAAPVNVNTAGFDSLKMLFLLSDSQIDQIIAFRKKYGYFLHVNELLWVPGIGRRDLANVLPFITLGAPDRTRRMQSVKKRMKTEVLSKLRATFPKQEGYKIYSPDQFEKKKEYERKVENRFQGPPVGTLVKYKLNYGSHIQAGLTLENDPGEAYFNRNQKTGFDFLSAHVYVTTNHWMRKLVVGDYRLQWGQGLVAWGGFASGKSDVVVGNEKSGKGFAPYTSTDENNYLRGVSVSLALRENLTADLFFSKKKTDGNVVQADTLADEDLLSVSLYESGYHRNYSECNKKHTLKELTTGMSFCWNTAAFKLGINTLYYDFSPVLIPGDRVYQQYNDTGDKRWLASIDYKTAYRGCYFFGETAVSREGGWATIDGVRLSYSWWSACLLYRRYDKRYVSHYAAGFGEYSNTSNEEGFYGGLGLTPLKNLKVNLYYDWFRFFAARYGATIPGKGWELLTEASYQQKKWTHILRYKHEIRPEDIKGGISVNRGKSEYRYQVNYQYHKQLEGRTRLSLSQYHKDMVREKGYMIYQDLIFATKKTNFRLQYRLAWFDTDSYQSRIYAYENNVLYGYSFPAFMGRGWRTYTNLTWKPVRLLTCYLKAGFMMYQGQDQISSGLTQVNGNKLYDLTFQLRVSF